MLEKVILDFSGEAPPRINSPLTLSALGEPDFNVVNLARRQKLVVSLDFEEPIVAPPDGVSGLFSVTFRVGTTARRFDVRGFDATPIYHFTDGTRLETGIGVHCEGTARRAP